MRVKARRCSTSRSRPSVDVGDEHARRVRPDVDAGAAALTCAGQVAMMGRGDRRRPPSRWRTCARPTAAHEAVRGIDFTRRAAARCSACSGPTAPARRRRSRSSRATATRSGGRRVACSATTPASGRPTLRERVGIVLQSCGIYPHLTVRETVAHWASLYPAPRDVDEVDRARRASRRRRPPRAHAVGRPAAAARLRARAGRRPRAGVPRRADDRLRPRRAARGVGDRALAARRSARPSCSPRTTSTRRRRSPTAWRSSRTARSSPRARPASSARPALPRRAGATPTAASERETDDPTALLHELTAAALARGERLEELSVTRPRSRTSTSS